MIKRKRTNNDLQSITQKKKTTSNMNPTKNRSWSRGVNSPCSTCGTNLVTTALNPVISREWGEDRIVITTNGTYPWSFVTIYSIAVNQIMVATFKLAKGWLQLNQFALQLSYNHNVLNMQNIYHTINIFYVLC
jgi:hypothetical protein